MILKITENKDIVDRNIFIDKYLQVTTHNAHTALQTDAQTMWSMPLCEGVCSDLCTSDEEHHSLNR